MIQKLAFIGCGNMGEAMISSLINSRVSLPEDIIIYDVDLHRTNLLRENYGLEIASSELEAVDKADIIILAVKPNIIKKVLTKIKDNISSTKVLVSIAVGISINYFKTVLGHDKRIVRVMPNTPALVNEAMTVVSFDLLISDSDKNRVLNILNSMGRTQVIQESLMSQVTSLTGSSPAYVYMMIEAMADGAVKGGIPRSIAYELAAQAVLGSAKMVLETGLHPGVLKDQVCSPAGTTIDAVECLEKNSFRYSIMSAMDVCNKKAAEIGKAIEEL